MADDINKINESKPVRAMILAAGLGTRLKPVTDTIPKALVKFNGRTLLEISLAHLKEYGIRDVIINVHHFAGQIIDFLAEKKNFGMNIAVSDESDELLDTGGGVKKASWFFDDCPAFIVRNVDVISDLDLQDVLQYHFIRKPLATLVVRDRKTARNLLFNEAMILYGWENRETGKQILARSAAAPLRYFAFSGIQVLDPVIFDFVSNEGKFSLTDMYLHLAKDHDIKGYIDIESSWLDAGKKIKP